MSFNSIVWIPGDAGVDGYLRVVKNTFNSIVWILHHHALCSLWKFLSSPLYGFYSIEPPGGGSMYMV